MSMNDPKNKCQEHSVGWMANGGLVGGLLVPAVTGFGAAIVVTYRWK